jgi:ABC-2 type transport system permease protein
MTATAGVLDTAGGARRLGRTARKYVAAFRVSLMSQLAYPAEMWLRTIFVLIIMFIFSSLWHTTYAELGRETLGGLDLSQMLWYLAITESILLSRPRETLRIDEEVRTGQLAYQLARPYNYVLYRFAQMWGERLPRFLLTLAVAALLATLFSGGSGVSWGGLLAGPPALLLALTIDFLFVLTISLLAFWVEDTTPFLFIYDRFLMILGGMLLPLELFPGPLEAVARVLPFSAIVYAPARMFVDPDPARLAGLLLQQGVMLLVAMLIAGGLFRYAERRLQANGG